MSRALIAGAVLAAGLVSGGMLIQDGGWREADASTGTPRLLDQVVTRVANDFIDSLSIDDLLRKAAVGFVDELEDPASVLLSAGDAERLRETTTGRYAGVGVELDMRDGYVTVIAPLAGTPADSAGIEPGDRIISINAKTTFGLSMDEVQEAMRGPQGSTIKLTMERGTETPVFTLTRRVIVFHPVQRTEILPGNVGYVQMATFSDDAAAELRDAVTSLRRRGATKLILDLRENPGGLLAQGIEVADLFLDRGQMIARTRGRIPDANRSFTDAAPQSWPDLRLVALVDSGTASAAEIVAGALQDNGRAVVIGSPTYGKGSAQSLFPVTGGRALKLTTARWFTPDGRTIERDSTTGGITPDIEARQPDPHPPVVDDSIPLRPAPKPSLTADPVIQRALRELGSARR